MEENVLKESTFAEGSKIKTNFLFFGDETSLCLSKMLSMSPSAWKGLSRMHLTSPEKGSGEKISLRSFSFFNIFGLLLSSFWKVCQNCVLRVQRNVLIKTIF